MRNLLKLSFVALLATAGDAVFSQSAGGDKWPASAGLDGSAPYHTIQVDVDMTDLLDGIGAVGVECHLYWKHDQSGQRIVVAHGGTLFATRSAIERNREMTGDILPPVSMGIEAVEAIAPQFTRTVPVALYARGGQRPEMWKSGDCQLIIYEEMVDFLNLDAGVIGPLDCSRTLHPDWLAGCLAPEISSDEDLSFIRFERPSRASGDAAE